MKPINELSSSLQAHLLETRMLQLEVKIGAAGVFVENGLGTAAIVNAANGTSTVTLPAEKLGIVKKARSVEVISAGAATVTASVAVSSDDLVISLDSNTDYTAADDTIELRVVYKI